MPKSRISLLLFGMYPTPQPWGINMIFDYYSYLGKNYLVYVPVEPWGIKTTYYAPCVTGVAVNVTVTPQSFAKLVKLSE